MKFKFPFRNRKILLSGDVINLHFKVQVNDNIDMDNRLWEMLVETEKKLKIKLEESVYNHFHGQLEIKDIFFSRGSVTILIILGSTYYAISKYKSFIESIELLISHIKSILRRHFNTGSPSNLINISDMQITGSWTDGPALTNSVVQPFISGYQISTNFLLGYLVFSHLIMLATIIFMVWYKYICLY